MTLEDGAAGHSYMCYYLGSVLFSCFAVLLHMMNEGTNDRWHMFGKTQQLQFSKKPVAHNPSVVHVTFISKYITVSAVIEEQDLERSTVCQPG